MPGGFDHAINVGISGDLSICYWGKDLTAEAQRGKPQPNGKTEGQKKAFTERNGANEEKSAQGIGCGLCDWRCDSASDVEAQNVHGGSEVGGRRESGESRGSRRSK